MMAVTFTDFNKFGTYRKAMEQWSQKAKNSCQKFELRLKILEKLRQKGGKFSVLQDGVFGLKKENILTVLGKFCCFYIQDRL